MESRMRVLRLVLVVGLGVAAMGCDGSRRTPAPTPTPSANMPAEVLSARDAALAYVRQAYPSGAPPEGLTWQGQDASAEGLVGASVYEFVGAKWVMTVQVPVVSPDIVTYEMELANGETGFQWTGMLDASYGVLESNLDVAAEVLAVRDAIVSYVQENYPQRAVPQDLVWVGERTTPEGSMGHESCQFAADGWLMTIEYDLVLPVWRIYHFELGDSRSGSLWRGQIDVDWIVLEHR